MPNLKTGRMEPLISALTEEEEEQFGNCIRRLNTLLQVLPRVQCHVYSATCTVPRVQCHV